LPKAGHSLPTGRHLNPGYRSEIQTPKLLTSTLGQRARGPWVRTSWPSRLWRSVAKGHPMPPNPGSKRQKRRKIGPIPISSQRTGHRGRAFCRGASIFQGGPGAGADNIADAAWAPCREWTSQAKSGFSGSKGPAPFRPAIRGGMPFHSQGHIAYYGEKRYPAGNYAPCFGKRHEQ